MLFFAIADLYFAYQAEPCTYAWISNTKLGFGLGTWLKVSGYTNLVFLLLPILSFFLPSLSNTISKIHQLLSVFYIFFRFIWVVLGAIIFWGHLSNTGMCSQLLNTYMWINLIYSFFIILTMCYNQQQTYVVSNSFGTRTYL
jgi:hypothetical protein